MELDGELEAAALRLLWTRDEGRDDAVRGHLYPVATNATRATLLWLVHDAASTPRMIAAAKVWDSWHALDAAATLRDRMQWKWHRGHRWTLTGDAGKLETLLRGRTIEHRLLLGSPPTDLFDGFPEPLARSPVTEIASNLLPGLPWPEGWNATELCPRFTAARIDDHAVIAGCRYGSVHALGGQNRTAAVWLTNDAGGAWHELGWALDDGGERPCWPPEQIDRIVLRPVDGVISPIIQWDDPWILFEPGTEWVARWRPHRMCWTAAER